ncbi:MAG TPA: pectate lyase, partial [Flavisolibacter sp.]
KNAQDRLLNPYHKKPQLDYGTFYVAGNVVEGAEAVTADNWKGVVMHNGTEADKQKAKMETAFAAVPVPMQAAGDAFEKVLQQAGASFRRDTLDQRIVRDVQNKTGTFIDVQGGYPHGTPYGQTITAWPTLKTLPAPKDSDSDGMPDDWEQANNLNPQDGSDAVKNTLHKHYTNIEMYINSIINVP